VDRETAISTAQAVIIGAGEPRGLLRESDFDPVPCDECDARGEILSLDSTRIVDRILGLVASFGS
jgi:hypothetical protein